ncbi:MAG: hypothetical protein K0R12_506 [Gammaproteobacteria bacterium]|nr:hypothetical protein [Gammaproteobacteria bacterium]
MHLDDLERLLKKFRMYKDLPYCLATAHEIRDLSLVQYYRDMEEIINALVVAINTRKEEKVNPPNIVGNHIGMVAQKCLQGYINNIEEEKPKKPNVNLNKENVIPPRNKLVRTNSIGNISSLMFSKPLPQKNAALPPNKLVRTNSIGNISSLMFAKPPQKTLTSDLKRNRENENNNAGSAPKRHRLTSPATHAPIISPRSFSLVKKTACYAQAAFREPDKTKVFEYLFELLGKPESQKLLETLIKAVNSNDTSILRHELKFDPAINTESVLFHYGTKAFEQARLIFLTCISKKTFTSDFRAFKAALENYCHSELITSSGICRS